MQKSLEQIVDIIALTVFLVAAVTIGISGLYSLLREVNHYSLEVEDKNSALKLSDTSMTEGYDSLLSVDEICLVTQIQDSGSGSKVVLLVGGHETVIETASAGNTERYASEIRSHLNENYRYLVRYDYRTDTYCCTPYNPVTYSAEETPITSIGTITSGQVIGEQTYSLSNGQQIVTASDYMTSGKTYLLSLSAHCVDGSGSITIETAPAATASSSRTYSLTKKEAAYSLLVTATDSMTQFRIKYSGTGDVIVSNMEITQY